MPYAVHTPRTYATHEAQERIQLEQLTNFSELRAQKRQNKEEGEKKRQQEKEGEGNKDEKEEGEAYYILLA